MKLLVFAHVPPPHHGQSQMVQYLVQGLRTRPELGVEVLHVNARFSDDLQDVGAARGGKIWKLLRFCGRALALRWKTGTKILYYIPSPPQRTPLVRDWLVLAILRPWFPSLILHWHSVGLGEWLEKSARSWERGLSRLTLGRATLSIALSSANQADAEKLQPRRAVVVENGTPDPCPDFNFELADWRRTQLALRQAGGTVKVIFMALGSKDKGLFDALEAIVHANAEEAGLEGALRFTLTVAGSFPSIDLEKRFLQRVMMPDLKGLVEHVGFIKGMAKAAALRDADLFLFPTYYANEGQPVGIIEAMAFGLPVVTTRWRGIPEMLPPDYPGLVEPKDPVLAAEALRRIARTENGLSLRARYEARFALPHHIEALAKALHLAETPQPAASK